MENALKLLSGILILFALYMGLKQGWAMFSGKAEMIDFFGKWGIPAGGIKIIGILTLIGAVLTLIPQTFLYGNFLTACGILFIIALELSHRDLKGVAIELPFFLLSLVIIYLRHPFSAHN